MRNGPVVDGGLVVRAVGVVGGAATGAGVAYAFAVSGARTTLVEPDDDRMDAVRSQVAAAAQDSVARGELSTAAAALLPDLIEHASSVDRLPEGLDLVVETGPGDLDVRRRLLAGAEARVPAVLASATGTLAIDRLAAELDRPDLFLGLHFSDPVSSAPLVEVVPGAATSSQTLQAAIGAVHALGKVAAVVSDTPGLASGRLDVLSALEAIRMVEQGVGEPAEIDRAVQAACEHPVGPLRRTDLVGLDVRLAAARELERALGPRFAPPQLLVDMVEAGRLGRKSGQGFYSWP